MSDTFGEAYEPSPGVTFLAFGGTVRSLVDLTEDGSKQGLVGLDLEGKWNHGAKDTLSIICRPDAAKELADSMTDAAEAAPKDQEAWERRK